MTAASAGGARLARRLSLGDAVVVGLGAMLGAGVFVAYAPAARAAGAGLLVGLVVAAAIAGCNAASSARLAARYPESGGTYVYGRARLGDVWGYLAGWGFVVGKTASCSAMALTVGTYAWPSHPRVVAAAAVVSLTAVDWFGVRASALVTRVVVALVLLVLAVVVVAAVTGGHRAGSLPAVPWGGPRGVLQAAGFLFFAFAGYARVATLGEEVRDPARSIPRAVAISLGIVLAVYVVIAVTLLAVLGPARLAASVAPLSDLADASGADHLDLVVRVGACVAAAGSLLALLLGVSRTMLAMARQGDLPRALAAVHPRHRVPYRAELAVGLVVLVLVLSLDLRAAIGFSSFAVLVYYAIANASAVTLGGGARVAWVPLVGIAGCAAVALSLPLASVVSGLVVLVVGLSVRAARRLMRG